MFVMFRVMLNSLMAAGLAVSAAHAHAAPRYDLLVGTYTSGSSEGIYRYRFDSATGQISAKPVQVLAAQNPSWLALNKKQTLLFAVNENGPGQKDTVGKVSSYSIADDNTLSLINQQPTQGDEPTHVSLSTDGDFIFVSNYAVSPQGNASLAVLAVDDSGRLGEVEQQFKHSASHVDPERQVSSHVHSVVSSPNRSHYVYASDLGADRIFIYQFTPSNAHYPLNPAAPSSVILPPGSGPRHLLFNKSGKQAYLVLEMSAQVAVLDYRAGNLIRKQLLNLSDNPGPTQGAGGGLHLSPDGRFLYVSNRGKVNQIVVYAVNPEDGTLKAIQHRGVDGDHPREFALDPTGGYLLVANQKSNAIVVMQRDPKTGLIGRTVQTFSQDAPSDLKFLSRRPEG
ncbi:6-phosphogluconolactonase, cycloisomerase 2 family [Pseudomonas sp. URIL14HWK12:I9]|nr:6-phosphogluconolactonase (cycloisomerase 2 family) [Pseudomonas sp. URIL14HWK12:I12]PVZ24141.1 6-phosphogluconolactonase (cycloisomerase 2 family) [Pseudomonas sp. URIL14HWK12:I10]PVZ33220.1 6-phosphogluconolactonase (cycloisomerase 2 family) [Pseudomonas sp. URIL14HWK12:I11]SNZ10770.1 6-phosphogluconolactonase, cycloisomerase 2 family [Pseudomonas sp. URIL14HWK12:I9]